MELTIYIIYSCCVETVQCGDLEKTLTDVLDVLVRVRQMTRVLMVASLSPPRYPLVAVNAYAIASLHEYSRTMPVAGVIVSDVVVPRYCNIPQLESRVGALT